MNYITVIGIAASVFTSLSMIPQLVKLLKEKKANNISLGMLAVLFMGLALWIYYGAMKEDLIIILANSFGLVVSFITGVFAWRYKR